RASPKARNAALAEELARLQVERRAERQDEALDTGLLVGADAVDHLIRRADQDAGLQQRQHRAELLRQLRTCPFRAALVGRDREADVDAAHDGLGIAPLDVAPAVEHS